MIGWALAFALLMGAAPPDPILDLLSGVPVSIVDAAKSRSASPRGTATKGLMFDSCTLGLQYRPAGIGPQRIALRDIRYVRGDGDMLIEISLTTKPEESLIFTVSRDRYAGGIALLTSRAEGCGAKLAAPPPVTRRP